MVKRATRRGALRRLAALPALMLLGACRRPHAAVVAQARAEEDPDAALYYRYRGIPGGGELYIDADYETNAHSVVYDARGVIFAYGVFSPRNRHHLAYFGDEVNGGLPVPRTLRMVRYPEDAQRNPEGYYSQNIRVPMFLGEPLVDVTVPVASRIPDAVLDRIRKYHGGLKLKLRLTRETLLIGWEIRNGKDYPWKTDQNGRAYATDEDVMIGGDFCEKQVIYRMIDGRVQQIRRKGWQIDPKTGQRIETDF